MYGHSNTCISLPKPSKTTYAFVLFKSFSTCLTASLIFPTILYIHMYIYSYIVGQLAVDWAAPMLGAPSIVGARNQGS